MAMTDEDRPGGGSWREKGLDLNDLTPLGDDPHLELVQKVDA